LAFFGRVELNAQERKIRADRFARFRDVFAEPMPAVKAIMSSPPITGVSADETCGCRGPHVKRGTGVFVAVLGGGLNVAHVA
jgi:hypothetical protein